MTELNSKKKIGLKKIKNKLLGLLKQKSYKEQKQPLNRVELKSTDGTLKPVEFKSNEEKTYYFVLASNDFLFSEEPIEEILRERYQYYKRINLPLDFWLIRSPKFLQTLEMQELRNKLDSSKSYSAIVSTDEIFVRWLKLRLLNVATGKFAGPTSAIPSPLGSSCDDK
uniref:Ycf54 n=1 Tax=Desmarestia aculeata TaxID=62298 RepID=A0A8F0JZL8_9PHAE|nr:hypothetical protein [Desmarestia aculeata]